jgi:uncharacterized membrane protein YjdF
MNLKRATTLLALIYALFLFTLTLPLFLSGNTTALERLTNFMVESIPSWLILSTLIIQIKKPQVSKYLYLFIGLYLMISLSVKLYDEWIPFLVSSPSFLLSVLSYFSQKSFNK